MGLNDKIEVKRFDNSETLKALAAKSNTDGNEYLEEIQDDMEYEQVSDILMAKVEEKYEVEYFEPEQ